MEEELRLIVVRGQTTPGLRGVQPWCQKSMEITTGYQLKEVVAAEKSGGNGDGIKKRALGGPTTWSGTASGIHTCTFLPFTLDSNPLEAGVVLLPVTTSSKVDFPGNC